VVLLPGGKLSLNVFLLRETRVQLKHCALKLNGHLLILLERDLQFVDFELIGGTLLFHRARQLVDLGVLKDAHLLHLYSQLIEVVLVERVDAGDLSLPGGVLLFLHLLLAAHLIKVVCLLFGQPVLQILELAKESILLLLELLISTRKLLRVLVPKVSHFAPVSFFLGEELIVVPFIDAGMFIRADFQLTTSLLLIFRELLVPLVFTLDGDIAQVRDRRILTVGLGVVAFVLLVKLRKVGHLRLSCLAFLLLNLVHQLLDLGLKLVLELLFHLGVFLNLLGCHGQCGLEILAGGLAFAHELLVLSDILLEVVEDLKLLIKGDQSVELVLQLDVSLLQGKLELVVGALVEHGLRELLRRGGGG